MYIDILEGETHSFRRIVVRDGQAVIAITMTAKPMIVEGKALRLPDNTVRTYRLYADDTSLIEKLMVRMLDRLTVLGLTSKPISSASEAARKYVAAKQKNPPKVRIFEKGVEQGITR
ncbi:hypothetical protein [Armatimonas sp.]|uniref:hypothetical protein n=1 Tax=Armatimonas sp. TaxID=1872638 RepID=UPI003751D546